MKSSHRRFALLTFATAVSAAALAVSAVAQNPDPQETVGQKFTFKANQLVDPYATPATARRSTTAPRPPEAKLRLPPGFQSRGQQPRRAGPRQDNRAPRRQQ